jgi:surface antigen
MHRRHHSAAFAARLIALVALGPLAACGEYDSMRGLSFDFGKIDWTAKLDEYAQPAPLGTFFNRRPPPVWIRASGPFPGPLSEPLSPVIAASLADAIVAEPFRATLDAEARMNLAQASMIAASAATGTPVAWKAADAGGAVVPARDVYLSHRGHVCRDLQQQVETRDGTAAAQVTLCRADAGDNRILWLPGRAD